MTQKNVTQKEHLAVNGTLMRNLELNPNLLAVGATFVCATSTAPCYRLWSIDDRHPAMMRVSTGGAAIDLEVWELPVEGIVTILRKEPPGLCIGRVELISGEAVPGVLGEPYLCETGSEITRWGGWRQYIASAEFNGMAPHVE